MKSNLFLVTALGLALSLSTGVNTADAHHKKNENHNHTAAKVAGVIALGVLGAALASHQHKRGAPEYTPHPRFHPDENAVGRCMYRARRLVQDAGGHYAQLDNVSDVRFRDNGKIVVRMQVTGYYPFAHKTSDVRCVVKNGRVREFEY